MIVKDFMMADLAVILQGVLLSCDDSEAEALADAVPYMRALGMEERRRQVADWMRKVFAFLAGRLDELPEDPAIDAKEITRREYNASGMGIAAVLADPVLRPILLEEDRKLAEDGLMSMDEVMDAVHRGMVGKEMLCPECRTPMMVMFTSIECPACGARSARS